MSTSAFGLFSLFYSVANVLMNLISFGGNLHLIYGVSREKNKKYELLFKSFFISFLIAIAAITICSIFLFTRFESEYVKLTAWSIALGFIMALSALLFAFFKGMGQFDKEAKGFSIFFVQVLICVFVFYISFFSNSTLPNLQLLLVFNLIVLSYGLFCLRSQMKCDGVKLNQFPSFSGLKSYWNEKLPYGLHELQCALYTHINIILLGFLVPEEGLGIYKSVYLLIVPVSVLPSIFSQVQLNHLATILDDKTAFLKSFRSFLVWTTALGVVIFIPYALAGTSLVDWIYEGRFNPNLTSTLVLCFTLTFLFRFASANYGVLITSVGNQKIRVYVTLLSFVVSVVLTVWLTNNYGITGAAIAMTAAYFTMLVCYALYGELVILKKIRRDVDSSFRT